MSLGSLSADFESNRDQDEEALYRVSQDDVTKQYNESLRWISEITKLPTDLCNTEIARRLKNTAHFSPLKVS